MAISLCIFQNKYNIHLPNIHSSKYRLCVYSLNPCFFERRSYKLKESVDYMDITLESFVRPHDEWKQEVGRLHNSLSTLKNTDPKKMIQHFFLQAVNYEFSTESEVRSGIFKRIIDLALNRPLNNSIRQRSADILKKE